MAIIIADTRERQPYGFDKHTVIRKKLPFGDYSLEGLEDRISFERKTLDDYVGSLILDRERFMREMCALSKYDVKGIIVEANMEDVINEKYTSGTKFQSIVGATSSLIIDFRIPVYFLSNRQIARHFVEDMLVRYANKYQKITIPPSPKEKEKESPECQTKN
jgi:ERCC4-type nuclease